MYSSNTLRVISPPSPRTGQNLAYNDELVPEAQTIEAQLKAARIRCSVDSVADKLGAKIRKAELAKVPHMIILGKKPKRENFCSLSSEQSLEACDHGRFLEALIDNINRRELPDPKCS